MTHCEAQDDTRYRATDDVHDPGPVPDDPPGPIDPDEALRRLRIELRDYRRAEANAQASRDLDGRRGWLRHARVAAVLVATLAEELDEHLTAGGPLPVAWKAIG